MSNSDTNSGQSELPKFDEVPVYALGADAFTDYDNLVINFEYFRKYFDQVSLPMELAKSCLGDLFEIEVRQTKRVQFVKFIRLSSLRQCNRLPMFQEVSNILVDYRDINGFTLQGPLNLLGEEDIYSDSPCMFVSHRWQSADHPDPDGSQLAKILDRFSFASRQSAEEIYLWIDFSCLPQPRAGQPLATEQSQNFQLGLARLPEIVKSCDLLLLCSPDYLDRAWCYAEIFVWLCRLNATRFTKIHRESQLFKSVQTRHLHNEWEGTSGHQFNDTLLANLSLRGYDGPSAPLLKIYNPINTYRNTMEDSYNYNVIGATGGFDWEYLPSMVNILCNTWRLMQFKGSSLQSDKELCLRVIMDGIKFNRYARWDGRPAQRQPAAPDPHPPTQPAATGLMRLIPPWRVRRHLH